MYKIGKKNVALQFLFTALTAMLLTGCANKDDGKTEITLVQYKPEAVVIFDELEDRFNAAHNDIHLTIESPNDAMTILKTRFIREDIPDIIGIGGDVNYSNFLDAEMIMDISDFDGLENIKQAYKDIDKALEYVPYEGVYVANAAGMLYNKDMFDEHGWEIPTTWQEFLTLCEGIEAEGILPMYFGFRETWTCLAPWNAIAVGTAPSDVCQQVNRGDTTFAAEYRDVAEKMQTLLEYGPADPFAYDYNGACTAFANGEAAMYPIGNYAVPQIRSVNPDMNIDSFVFPVGDSEADNVLNSGIDLQFCVMEACENKEAAYEVLRFLLEDESIQTYLDQQDAVPCKEGDFALPVTLTSMKGYIDEGRMADYQDHYYPAEMSVDAQIQTFLMNGDVDAFLTKFDNDWKRYNRDVIRKVQEYEAEHSAAR